MASHALIRSFFRLITGHSQKPDVTSKTALFSTIYWILIQNQESDNFTDLSAR